MPTAMGMAHCETAPGLQPKSEIRKSRTWWEVKENLVWDPRICSALTRSVAWRMPVLC